MKDQQMKYCEQLPAKYRGVYDQAMTGRKALKPIRAKCLDCMGWNEAEVRRCDIESCPLWPYRHGRLAKPGANPECEITGDEQQTPVDGPSDPAQTKQEVM